MKPFARQTFICSAIEKCQEKVSCCPHKTAHIKDERCVPRECRYAPGAGSIDCDPFDPENPRAPVLVPVAPVKTVEETLKAKIVVAEPAKEEPAPAPVEESTQVLEDQDISHLLADVKAKEEKGEFVPIAEAAKELHIKEAVKKQASSKKKGRKA